MEEGKGLTGGDLVDILGCGPTTIVNRLNRDDPSYPLTIYELVRGIRQFGPEFGNDILTKAGGAEVCANEIKLTTSTALTLFLELLKENDLSDEDAILLAPVLVKLIGKYQAIVTRAFAASGRAV